MLTPTPSDLVHSQRRSWACGAPMQNSDHIVALSSNRYAGGAHCWKHIGVHYKGKFVDATIADLCPGCGHNGIDLSPSALEKLAPLDEGRIQVTWNYE
ncbi:RlpA-like double-psi beta-barrel-protein domain-containing protein-containing protein [Armillaria nabsnona]|nr:RlpA-like double-psi beta-barrel-protein domain-containing protein-containing protein [Armillaria nabsnona]